MQLTRLAPRIQSHGRPLWVTFESPQSRSLLEDVDTLFVRFTAPRDWQNVARNLHAARQILAAYNIVEVVSTGSAVALSFIPPARARNIPCRYIESAARSDGPSVTGRLLALIPGVQTYTQYHAWPHRSWHYVGSVFDEFRPGPTQATQPATLNVLVSLGTLPYRFDRMIQAVKRIAAPSWRITWQVGPNDYGDLEGERLDLVTADNFAALCRQADLVISHAGVGSALTALEAGRHPVLLCRTAVHGEHVDDHQRFVASELASRQLATTCDPEELTQELALAAAGSSTDRAATAQPLMFAES